MKMMILIEMVMITMILTMIMILMKMLMVRMEMVNIFTIMPKQKMNSSEIKEREIYVVHK